MSAGSKGKPSDQAAPGRIPDKGEMMGGRVWFSRRGYEITLGLTDAGLEAAGDIQSIELADEGSPFEAGDMLFAVEGAESNLEIEAPAPGNVIEVNAGAARDPELVEDDPLESGWLVRVEVADGDLRGFLSGGR